MYNETIAQISEKDDARVLTEVSRAIIPPLMFSLIVSALVVMVYHVVPGVRRHPNFLIYIKAWADLFWCVFTAVPAVALAAGDKCFCSHSSGHFVAFATEFSLATSILCLLMLSVDLVLNSRSPFANFKQNLRCYTIWIPIGALALSVALISSGNIGLYLLGFCLTPYVTVETQNLRETETTTTQVLLRSRHESSSHDCSSTDRNMWSVSNRITLLRKRKTLVSSKQNDVQ